MRGSTWSIGPVLAVGLGALTVAAYLASSDVARGSGSPAPGERLAAEEAVKLYLRLAAHAQGSAGDPRFLERIRAAPAVLDELVAGISFAAQRGRIEEPRLASLEFLFFVKDGADFIEVETREFWVTRVIAFGGEVRQTRSDVLNARYRLIRDGASWVVAGWSLGADGKGIRR